MNIYLIKENTHAELNRGVGDPKMNENEYSFILFLVLFDIF